MGNKINIFLVMVLLAASCGQGRKADKFAALPFPDVAVPGMITETQAAAEYMAMNMWNNLTDPSRDYPCDSTLVSGVAVKNIEQRFADWTAILDMLPRDKADKAVANLYDRALACENENSGSNVFETFVYLAELYFYDPNSPVRNEDNYHAFVKRLATYEGLDSASRGKYEFYARNTGLNRAGTVASDFRFSDRNGRIRTLHSIESPMTLLFFSNPGCEACMDIINVLKGDRAIAEKIASGELAVLNIYIDEDLQAWKEYMPVYPKEWYNGFDPDFILRDDTIYNIRAIPSLYLLDSDKRVILKDAPENRIFEEILKQ